MAVRKDSRDGRWRYRVVVKLSREKQVRVSGTPQINTKMAAETAEREHIQRVLSPVSPMGSPSKEVPTFDTFADEFMETYVASNNKPSEAASKKSILTHHLRPTFGKLRLDEITGRLIERYKAKLLAEEDPLSRKRMNNILIVLSKILRYAKELDIVDAAPTIKMLKVAPQKFDFFEFGEFEQLVAAGASEPEWQTMVLVAGEAGLRLGEILALEWRDIDLKRGQLTVMRTDWRGIIGSPKSGRDRIVPLTSRLAAALKQHRHLRGALVFSRVTGLRLTLTNMRAGLKRVCKRAGLRVVGWHVLRHTFCSHLAMKGAPAKAIQELAGHSSLLVTQRYMHLAPGALRHAIDLLDSQIPWQPGGNNTSRIGNLS